jgi:cell wall-associated NlpC family hydrolase
MTTTTSFVVGEGIQTRMDTDGVTAASDEVQVFGARATPQWAEACANDGSVYRWVSSVNQVYRYVPGTIQPPPPPAIAARLQSVVDAGLAQGWKRYAGPVIDEPDSFRWGDPGFDCSSFVSTMYRRVLGVSLAGFTDTIAGQTDTIDEADALPGDIILYKYNDGIQHGVTYPHTGLWLGGGLMLDCQYPLGLGKHPILAHPFEIHRARGL